MGGAVEASDDDDAAGDSVFRSRTRLLLGAGILLATVAFVGLVLDWRRVLSVLAEADLALLALGVFASIAGLACWSEALRHLLPRDAQAVSRPRGFIVYATGGVVRNVLPVGYASSIAVLAYVYRREATISINRSLAAVSVAELLIAIASTGVTVGGLALLVALGPVTPLVSWLAVGALILAVGGTLTGTLVWYRRETVRRVVDAAAAFVARAVNRLAPGSGERFSPAAVEETVAEYVRALSTVSGRRRAVAITFGYAVAGWLALVGAMYVSGLAVGYSVPIAVALFVVPIGGYATVLPVPGGLGGYELGVAGVLHLLGGLGLAEALAVTLLFRVCSYWTVIAVGAVATMLLSIDVRQLAEAAIEREPADARSGSGSADR